MIIVNQEPVDPSLIEDAFQRIKTTAELQTEVSCCERDEEFLEQAKQEVIDGILLAQEAERRYPKVPDEQFRPALELALRQWRDNGASWDLIETHMRQIREETAATLRMELFGKEIFGTIAEATNEEIEAFYAAHRADYFSPPSVHALHLIRFPDHSQPWSEYENMLAWRQQVKDGTSSFEQLAKAHTQKNNAEIDLDWVTLERLLNPFESILFSLEQGEVSPILSYENALHLVYPLEVKKAQLIPCHEKTDEIKDRILRQKKQQILRDLAQSLRAVAVIEGTDPILSENVSAD